MLEFVGLGVIVGLTVTILWAGFRAMAMFARAGEPDRPDYDPENPPDNPMESSGEAYLNRRPL